MTSFLFTTYIKLTFDKRKKNAPDLTCCSLDVQQSGVFAADWCSAEEELHFHSTDCETLIYRPTNRPQSQNHTLTCIHIPTPSFLFHMFFATLLLSSVSHRLPLGFSAKLTFPQISYLSCWWCCDILSQGTDGEKFGLGVFYFDWPLLISLISSHLSLISCLL